MTTALKLWAGTQRTRLQIQSTAPPSKATAIKSSPEKLKTAVKGMIMVFFLHYHENKQSILRECAWLIATRISPTTLQERDMHWRRGAAARIHGPLRLPRHRNKPTPSARLAPVAAACSSSRILLTLLWSRRRSPLIIFVQETCRHKVDCVRALRTKDFLYVNINTR